MRYLCALMQQCSSKCEPSTPQVLPGWHADPYPCVQVHVTTSTVAMCVSILSMVQKFHASHFPPALKHCPDALNTLASFKCRIVVRGPWTSGANCFYPKINQCGYMPDCSCNPCMHLSLQCLGYSSTCGSSMGVFRSRSNWYRSPPSQ